MRQQNNRKSLPTGAAPLPESLAADATTRRKEVAKVMPEFYYKFDFCTDIAKISRKRSKPDNHEHETERVYKSRENAIK
ncbi:hypothetical protein Tco_0442802, partial [Tanacetum coccineum]